MSIIFPDRKKKHPFLRWMSNWKYRWWDAVYFIRWKILRHTNVIKIKTLEPGYHDKPEILIHANFQILVDFVEREWGCKTLEELNEKVIIEEESSDSNTQWLDSAKEQNRNSREIFDLYLWWTSLRPNRINPYDYIDEKIRPVNVFVPVEWYDKEKTKPSMYRRDNQNTEHEAEYTKKIHEICKIEEDQLKEDTDMLVKLIGLRNHLWT